ncbi:hypothetical protein EVAR_36706_1 [Eumeta japonica]|uniref:Uncharacterized protein n=1 Tax=Eumeta variegata TaxID=151549 RepID=A0A4C1XSD6_EUMVA|nr:hypothetical protein EVAR_36706_1 [Eumeta japonica]
MTCIAEYLWITVNALMRTGGEKRIIFQRIDEINCDFQATRLEYKEGINNRNIVFILASLVQCMTFLSYLVVSDSSIQYKFFGIVLHFSISVEAGWRLSLYYQIKRFYVRFANRMSMITESVSNDARGGFEYKPIISKFNKTYSKIISFMDLVGTQRNYTVSCIVFKAVTTWKVLQK